MALEVTSENMKEHEKYNGNDLNLLEDLSPLKRSDDQSIRSLFPKESTQHTGRMRVALVRELIRRYGGKRLDLVTVADPMAGTGSTGVAAALEGCAGFVGCELIEHWANLAGQAMEEARGTQTFDTQIVVGNASDTPPDIPFNLLLTSPPFPNAHSQGKSEMQAVLRSSKATHAGNDFECNKEWGVGGNPQKELWIEAMARIIQTWGRHVAPGGHILLHVKNYVKKNQIVHVDQWAWEAFDLADRPDIEVVGVHSVPLNYRSGFQEWRRYPRQTIMERTRNGKFYVEKLACGHTKERKTNGARQLPKAAVCTACGPIPGLVEVRDERIVVARRNTYVA